MLVMLGKQLPKHALISIDKHVPFSIDFYENQLADIYWRCGNGQTSLLELGLSNKGEVINITLVSINSHNIFKNNSNFNNLFPFENFLPKFDVSDWNVKPEDYSSIFKDDFNCQLKLIVGLDYLELIFLNVKKSIHYFKNEKICFGINSDKELSSIQLINISQEDIELIKINF